MCGLYLKSVVISYIENDQDFPTRKSAEVRVVGGELLLEPKGQNLGGRAYLVAKMGELGISRRRAVAILNGVFGEMGLALARGGEFVEFSFGYLKAVQRRWEAPFTIDLIPDDEGWTLLDGETPVPWAPGWSEKVDKRFWIYRRDRAMERNRKERMKMLKRTARGGKTRTYSGK